MVSSGALRLGQWPVAFSSTELAARDLPVHVLAHAPRARSRRRSTGGSSERVLHLRQVGAVVGEEGDAREVPGDLRVGAAEAVGQLLAELRAVRVAHDHRRHRARPAEVVAVERLEQPVDVLAAEAADVVAVVDVAGRGADQDQLGEALRLLRSRRARRSSRSPSGRRRSTSSGPARGRSRGRRRRSPAASRTCCGRRRRGPTARRPTWSKRTIR